MLPTKYLSVKQVADILGVSIKTVYKYKDQTPGHIVYGKSIHMFDADLFYNGLKEQATKKTASKRPKSITDNRHGL